MMTFRFLIECKVWIIGAGLLSCRLLLEIIVDSFCRLSLREIFFSTHVRAPMWGVSLVFSTGENIPIVVLVGYVFTAGLVFCFKFVEAGVCLRSLLGWEVCELFEVLFKLGLLAGEFTIDTREAIWSLSSLLVASCLSVSAL